MNERIGKSRAELLEYVEKMTPSFWAEIGIVEECDVTSDPDQRIVQWICRTGAPFLVETESSEFVSLLQSQFGCNVNETQLFQLFDMKTSGFAWLVRRHEPRNRLLTHRQFAEWIVDRIPQYRFESVNIAGVDCLPAGIFFGIRDLLRKSHPRLEFAPSTPIQEKLKGAPLEVFWNHMKTQARISPPALHWPHRGYASAVALAGILIGFIGAFSQVWIGFQFSIEVSMLLVVSVAMILLGLHLAMKCRLPADIITFGDLARHLARAPIT